MFTSQLTRRLLNIIRLASRGCEIPIEGETEAEFTRQSCNITIVARLKPEAKMRIMSLPLYTYAAVLLIILINGEIALHGASHQTSAACSARVVYILHQDWFFSLFLFPLVCYVLRLFVGVYRFTGQTKLRESGATDSFVIHFTLRRQFSPKL